MILSIGIDISDISRFTGATERHPGILERLFTSGELSDTIKKTDRLSSLSARFAAKEAVLKALKSGWGKGVGWRDVEIVASEGGAPSVLLHNRADEIFRAMGGVRLHLSITHDGGIAAAVAIIES